MAKRDIRLTPTSYIVLGLISAAGRATPYDLKRVHQQGIGGFWELNHAQIYAEPDRLVAGGYLCVEQEDGGRRRKLYELTSAGRAAFAEWLASPTERVHGATRPGPAPALLRRVAAGRWRKPSAAFTRSGWRSTSAYGMPTPFTGRPARGSCSTRA